MKNPYDRRVSTDFSVLVEVNGAKMHFRGDGDGDAGTGEVSVAVATHDPVPVGFNPGLLSFAMITGQPDISAMEADIVNPFQEVHGEYHGIRRLDLGKLGHLLADYRITRIENGRRTANFHISGTTSAPEVLSLEPAFEVWVPQGPGLIHGHFSMIWRTASDEWVKGEVESEYRLPTEQPLDGVHYRRIEFRLEVAAQSLRQSETIMLFAPKTANVLVAR